MTNVLANIDIKDLVDYRKSPSFFAQLEFSGLFNPIGVQMPVVELNFGLIR